MSHPIPRSIKFQPLSSMMSELAKPILTMFVKPRSAEIAIEAFWLHPDDDVQQAGMSSLILVDPHRMIGLRVSQVTTPVQAFRLDLGFGVATKLALVDVARIADYVQGKGGLMPMMLDDGRVMTGLWTRRGVATPTRPASPGPTFSGWGVGECRLTNVFEV